jgi:hypothetical protein
MSKKEFENFLSNTKENELPKDWYITQKKEWLDYLKKLYQLFESALQEYIEKKNLAVKYQDIRITEEGIGSYMAPSMNIEFGGLKVTLKPIGTLLIGSKGRVDMTGKGGTVRIILVDSKKKGLTDFIKITVREAGKPQLKEIAKPAEQVINWEWRFISTQPSSLFVPVNQETIFTSIMALANVR